MEATKLIKIDSDLRTYGTNENFRYTLRTDIKFKRASLVYSSIPNTYYNIRTVVALATNDGGGGTINIPVGNYTISELVAVIQTSLQATDVTYTVVYDPITMRVIFDNSTPNNFELNFSGETELAERLGFSPVDLVGLANYVGDLTPQLIEQEFYINIREFGLVGDGADRNQMFTFVVPNIAIRGDYSILTTELGFNQSDFQDHVLLRDFTVELKRRNGELVDLNGANWTVILSTGY